MIIAAALSGGVDSAVAAYLLQKQGHQVIGITMILYPDCSESSTSCQKCRENHNFPVNIPDVNVTDAGSICKKLGISHYTADFSLDFRRSIIDNFAHEYKSGRTPNPCIRCNPLIKFGKLLDFARSLGAEKLATGHYAGIRLNSETGLYELLRGADRSKDQGYFLYKLDQNQLSRVVFPLEGLTKVETRNIAREAELPVAERKDSLEICFVKDNDYVRFIREEYPGYVVPGPMYHVNGTLMGQHRGLLYYTIGQRRRLGIAHPRPLYVVRIDRERNAIIVGYEEDLYKNKALIEEVHWISGYPPDENRVLCKIRYRHREFPASLVFSPSLNMNTGTEKDEKAESEGETLEVIFDEKQRAVTPGQSAVFYSGLDENIVLGGGVISCSEV